MAGNDALGRTICSIPPVEVAERCHDTAALLWQARGFSACQLDGVPSELAVGHALWIPPGVRHSLSVSADSVLLPIVFGPLALSASLREPRWITVDGDLRTMVLALLQVTRTDIRPDADLAGQTVRMLEERLVPPTGLPMPRSGVAYEVAEWLRDAPGDVRSVAELARTAHTSARTLERAFLAETGMTLRTWRSRRRMEVAAAMLRSGASVLQTAVTVGYGNAAAFRRSFTAHHGMPPRAFVARFRIPD